MKLESSILDKLTQSAVESQRLRMNYNLHTSFEDKVQRMFNAMEPGTEIPIARHPDCDETLVMLRGKLRVILYDDSKNIKEDVIIAPNTEVIGYHIPRGVWHKVMSLEHGTVCFETREGPYRPLAEEDILV